MKRLIFLLTITLVNIEVAYSRETCDLSKLPIRHSKNCSSFLEADKELNKNYKKLIFQLSKTQRIELIKIQRDWISVVQSWRNNYARNMTRELIVFMSTKSESILKFR